MASNSILGSSSYLILGLFVLFLCFFGHCNSLGELGPFNTLTVSSFSYPSTTLKPFELRYIRVELPPWFSSLSIAMISNVDLGNISIGTIPKSRLPVICFRDGSPPLPDVNTSISNSGLVSLSDSSLEAIQALENGEQCYPMQKNFTVNLTNEQISPGVLYLGLFNGIGSTRTQSKMINRGASYYFSANISVEGCTTSTMWGRYCNQTINPLFCTPSSGYNFAQEDVSEAKLFNQTINNVFCQNSLGTSCHGDGEPKVYTLDIMGVAEELNITAMNVRLNVTPSNTTSNSNGIDLLCFARHGAIPSATLHDYSINLSKSPLVIRSPRVGRWYITLLPVNLSKDLGGVQDGNMSVCYSMESKVLECSLGKAGSNCIWEKYILQTVLRKGSAAFESYYLPVSENVSSDSANFPLESLLTNYSYGGGSDGPWIYFILDIPRGAAGGNLHFRLTSDVKVRYEIYARFGGWPSLDSWDYYYANKTRNSEGSMFFKLYNSSEEKIDFYILYIKEGTWTFALRYLNATGIASSDQTSMSVSLERCPKRCSSHGECKLALDASGLTSYSYCSCDRNHGGFDCSIEIVSHKGLGVRLYTGFFNYSFGFVFGTGHIWQSISLIGSNAAAVLPAFWALRQKALAEWIVFTSSGISSGLYHACDVGTWCALSFNVLQFLDFWLSFMAVVSTFVYLSTISEVHKRAIHTAVAILTALMAITKATRSTNVILVIAIGTLGLLIGWVIEYSTKHRSYSFSIGFCLNYLDRWQAIRGWLHNLIKTILRRFRWGFILAGSTALAMAAISWKLETSESYWIWHSIWHVTIYTSSFFFLCSKSNTINNEDQRSPDGSYELTRQDSLPRGE